LPLDEKTVKEILERLEKLEAKVSSLLEAQRKPSEKPLEKPTPVKEEFKGLAGGINLMMKNGFFNTPRPVNEIQKELERLGYYHQTGAIRTALNRDFMKKKQILTRIMKDEKWHYVVKK